MKKYIPSLTITLFLLLMGLLFTACEKQGDDPDNPGEDEKVILTFDNGRGSITMVYCPGGTFLTNEDDGDTDFEDGPEVTCEPFWISETEITNNLLAHTYSQAEGFDFFEGMPIVGNPGIFNKIDENAHNYLCEDYAKWGGQYLFYKGEVQGFEYDLLPVTFFEVRSGRENQPCKNISWFGAVLFCNFLSNSVFGLTQFNDNRVYAGIDEDWIDDETEQNLNSRGFRLPTSIEWECAARWQGNDNSNDAYEYPDGSGQYWTRGGYASGASAKTDNVAATSAVAVYRYNDAYKPNPAATDNVIGDRSPNLLGLYDISGNVEEWCTDESENGSGRLLRGGSFVSQHYYVRIGEPPYGGMPADGTASDLGFRVVMRAEEK